MPAPPAPARGGNGGVVIKDVAALTQKEKNELQLKIDRLDDQQLDRVIEFLTPDLGTGSDGGEVQLDLDTLPPHRQRALVEVINAELKARATPTGHSQPEVVIASKGSPLFPAVEPGATPLALATPLAQDAATPRSETANADPAISAAKRQLAWEACSAREIQRQSHLREVREAASVSGGTPLVTPAGAEPGLPGEALPAMPEICLPPAAVTTGFPHVAAPTQTSTAISSTAAPPVDQGSSAGPSAAVAAATAAANAAGTTAAAAAPSAVTGVSGDSMLESTAEVLDLVDFGWM